MCFVLHVYISCFTNSFISNACGRWTFMKDFEKDKKIFEISDLNSVEFLGAERMPAQALESLFYSLLHICFIFYSSIVSHSSFVSLMFNVHNFDAFKGIEMARSVYLLIKPVDLHTYICTSEWATYICTYNFF